nr:hypothetical protein [Tanacetum cinerariifolium]
MIYGGMFVTRLARSFRILTREMLEVLSVEPPYTFKKKSMISMEIVMELAGGRCYWPVTRVTGKFVKVYGWTSRMDVGAAGGLDEQAGPAHQSDTRLQLYTKVDIKMAYSSWRRRHKSFVTASEGPRDDIKIFGDNVRDQTTALQPHFSRVKIQDPMLDHQDKYMMKAQVHMSKSSAISDIQALPRRKHYSQIYQMVKHMLRGRLLASFQDLEHEGGDTRSQGGIKDNDSKIKIQDHWRANDHSNKFQRTRLQVSRKEINKARGAWDTLVVVILEVNIKDLVALHLDQPLPADASPTALSPGYVVDSDPEEDEKDPKEDPADYPADRGDNDDDVLSNDDDDDDDDVEKDEEDE